MSFNNFKAKIWDASTDRDLKRLCVFAEDCRQDFEGEIKNIGDTVRIKGVGKPTIIEEDINSVGTIAAAETVPDSAMSIQATKRSYFNYGVGDIDKAQGANGVMSILSTEASEGLAVNMDTMIAGLCSEKQAVKYAAAATELTTENVLLTMDKCLEMLYLNDVSTEAKIVMTVPPWFNTIFRQAYIKLDTNNSEKMTNGMIGKYNNLIMKMSNNVYTSAGVSYIQVKTQRALGFVQSAAHSEPYRPENDFKDCVKGFKIYGAKILRPKEMITLNCKLGA